MARRKWYERVSAVALIAMLTMNSSEMGLRTLADMIPVSPHWFTRGRRYMEA